MVTDRDRKLLEVLTRLNTAIMTFSMNIAARRAEPEAHIEMALMLLAEADQTLKHVLTGEVP